MVNIEQQVYYPCNHHIPTSDLHRDSSRSPQAGSRHCSCVSTSWTAPASQLSSWSSFSKKNSIILPEARWGCIGEWGTLCHRRESPASRSHRTRRRTEHTQSSRPEKKIFEFSERKKQMFFCCLCQQMFILITWTQSTFLQSPGSTKSSVKSIRYLKVKTSFMNRKSWSEIWHICWTIKRKVLQKIPPVLLKGRRYSSFDVFLVSRVISLDLFLQLPVKPKHSNVIQGWHYLSTTNIRSVKIMVKMAFWKCTLVLHQLSRFCLYKPTQFCQKDVGPPGILST